MIGDLVDRVAVGLDHAVLRSQHGKIAESAELRELGPEARRVPALFTHGTQDPVVPMVPVRAQAQALKEAGLDLEWREFAKAHTVAGEAEIWVIRDFLTRHLGPGAA